LHWAGGWRELRSGPSLFGPSLSWFRQDLASVAALLGRIDAATQASAPIHSGTDAKQVRAGAALIG